MFEPVPSVDRALSILELLTTSRSGLSLSDLSRKLSLPKSSTYLVVTTLERRGYLVRNASGRYQFGLMVLSLGHAALQAMPLREVARPILYGLSQRIRMTIHLSVLERSEAVIVEKIEAPEQLPLASWVGRRLDVNCTGAGKVLAAYLPTAEFNRRFRPGSFARHNENSIVSIKRLKAELVETRARGYAIDDEEDELGVRCVGVPVLGDDGTVLAAISASSPADKLPRARIGAVADTLAATARIVSLQLRAAGGT